MDKQLRFHPEAAEELESAVDWYAERNPRAGAEFISEVTKALDTIAESPTRWPKGVADTRRFLLHKFPFAIIYLEEASVIHVIAVAHGRRKPGYWTHRV